MKNLNLNFNKKDVIFKRRLKTIDKDLYKMVQTIEAKKSYLASIVTANNWIITKIRTTNSNYQFCVNDSYIPIKEKEFFLYIPPFSLVQFIISPGTSYSIGYASKKPPLALNAFVTTDIRIQSIVESGFDQDLISKTNLINVERCSDPSGLSSSAKKIIDSTLLSPISFGAIAKQLKTSPAVLTRAFKKDFGLTPIEYRSRLRISSAIEQLVYGATILETSLGVGFSDLSRFYKQFKRITSLPPGKYKI